jgi:gas vesicle protein
MINEIQERDHPIINVFGVLVGALIGGLAGAVTMLLLAPQSGKRTRTLIQHKSVELRDRAAEMVEDGMEQVRMDRDKIAMNGRRKARELLRNGRALVSGQLEHVSKAIKAGKKTIQAS